MKKIIKDNIGLAIAIIITVIIVGWMWMGITSLFPDKNKAEKVFNKDHKILEEVVSYLEKSNSNNNIYFSEMMSFDKIKNKSFEKAIEELFKQGYYSIGKEGNTIYFRRWTRGWDFSAGIAYSINGKDKPVIWELRSLEPLSEAKWYYYEQNY